MSNRSFITSIAQGAIKAQTQYRILASLTIAQACLESGWGKATPGDNMFGIKWTAGCGYASATRLTQEEINGVMTNVYAQFRVYDSLADSLYDHAQFIVNNSNYKNIIGVTDYKTVCTLIKEDGYATDSAYTTDLIEIIEENNLQQYDNVQPQVMVANNITKIIQEQLNAVTNNNLTVDGMDGACTVAGIRQLQTILGIQVDGVWNAQCASCISQVYAKPNLSAQLGSNGYPVKIIQFRLGLQFDGVYGNDTANHVKAWQASKGLVADGIFGPQSWNKLL